MNMERMMGFGPAAERSERGAAEGKTLELAFQRLNEAEEAHPLEPEEPTTGKMRDLATKALKPFAHAALVALETADQVKRYHPTDPNFSKFWQTLQRISYRLDELDWGRADGGPVLSSGEMLRQRLADLLAQKAGLTAQALEQDPNNLVKLVPMLEMLLYSTTAGARVWAEDMVRKHADQILDLSVQAVDPSPILSFIPKVGSVKQQERLARLARAEFKGGNFSLLRPLFSNPANTAAFEFAFSLIRPLLDKWQLGTTDCLAWWRYTGYKGDGPHFECRGDVFAFCVQNNLKVLSTLERRAPGAAQLLHTEYGIRNFGRYPVELLARQAAEHVSPIKKPYGIILNARDDWNGAFFHNTEIFKGVMNDLGSTHSVKVVEASSKLEIARRLIATAHHHGPAEFAIIGGHGQADSIQFGNPSTQIVNGRRVGHEYVSLHRQDLFTTSGSGARKFFVKNPTFILNSCGTGTEAGIGQSLSFVFKADVVAPDTPTSLESIHASVDSAKRARFDVKYRNKKTRRRYVKGEN